MRGFVVVVQRDERTEYYNVVCDQEEEALLLVRAGFDLGNAAMRVLRPLAAWEIACFDLAPLVAKRASEAIPQPAPALGLGQR